MPTPTTKKDRHKGKKVLVWLGEEHIAILETLKTEYRLNPSDTLRRLIWQQEHPTMPKTVELPTCTSYSEIPNSPQYIKCLKVKGKIRILTKEQCRECKLYAVIEVPLFEYRQLIRANEAMLKRQKPLEQEAKALHQEISKLQHRKGELQNDIIVKENTLLYLKDQPSQEQILGNSTEDRAEKVITQTIEKTEKTTTVTVKKPQSVFSEQNKDALRVSEVVLCERQKKRVQIAYCQNVCPDAVDCPQFMDIVEQAKKL